MDAIYIPQLTRLPEQTETIQFEEFIPDLETLTPVKGWLKVKHQGNYLEVRTKAEAIATLTCHRCLQHYNHRLAIDASELIWLAELAESIPDALESEIAFDDLVETLSPQGYFQTIDWIYQQLCLELPPKQLCDQRCQGIQLEDQPSSTNVRLTDHRWASLEALKKQISP